MSHLGPDSAALVKIEVTSLVSGGGRASCTIAVTNGSSVALSSHGSHVTNLAWFIVDQDDAGPWMGDFKRIPFVAPIDPGRVISQAFDIPVAPCDIGRTLVVAFVAEGAFWSHLVPSPSYATAVIPSLQPWWDRRQARSIAFGNVKQLNRADMASVLGQNGKGRPLFLHLETVNICNLKCVICPYAVMQRDKETMSSEMFEDVISDYVEMGGGDVGLTPSVGDVFLDKRIVERVQTLRRHPEVRSIGFVTNAGNAGVLSDVDLSYVINECARINISVYGLDEEENAAMTRRIGKFAQIQSQIKRIVALNERASLVFAFRLLKEDADNRARRWMTNNFGRIFPHEVLTTFGNWGGAIDIAKPLPFQGDWLQPHIADETRKPCAYPALHLKVAVNGDVKFCSCIDYDSLPENIIGNVTKQSLSDIYNGLRAKQLWTDGLSICPGCTHYRSIDIFTEHRSLISSPIANLGI